MINTQDLMHDMNAQVRHGTHRVIQGVEIDSRRLQVGYAFFCLQGTQDGHKFIPQAVQAGAKVLVVHHTFELDTEVQEQYIQEDILVLAVSDTTVALQQAAQAHRLRVFKGTMVAITGSNGKTSCKEMLASMLSTLGPTLATQGNFNNHLGVPLTLFRLQAHHQFAVIEMGMSARGEIQQLAQWSHMDIGCIVSIARAHLQDLGSLEAVAYAKGELFTQLPAAPQGHAFLHADLTCRTLALATCKAQQHVLESTDLALSHIQHLTTGSQAQLSYQGQSYSLSLQSVGIHQLNNARLMLSIALHCGGDITRLLSALSQLKVSHLRGEVHQLNSGMTLWVDCYNANPQSILASLTAFQASGLSGCLVLGSVKELGDASDTLHQQLGVDIAHALGEQTMLICIVGQEAYPMYQALLDASYPTHLCHYFIESHEEQITKIIIDYNPPAVFIKGSRSNQLEKVAHVLIKQQDHPT